MSQVYGSRSAGRGSRADLSFLGIGRDRGDDTPPPERPRETKQEREARRLEKERQARLKERERSLREEGVDGGYLVTLGTYTGPEDFNKGVVRQLQIERRLAPFWKGLNDHSDSWTEAQLVAAVRGLPIPAADEIPPESPPASPQTSVPGPRSSEPNLNSLTVPISGRSQSYQSESSQLSASHPAFSSSGYASPTIPTSSAALLRGRAKTLASLATGRGSSSDLTMREIQLPKDPKVNGLPLEAYLYREASECPICFLYYPPYLNRTRCCDQPICSECFVQIKRPDPHPPEHEQPGQPRPPEEEAEMLVSEVAACPFCVTPEFGVTYEPPPFRRGLAYAGQGTGHPLKNLNSAMSSSSSLTGGAANRRRATSLSATAPNVITTDKVRPDWAKKLADARAHALRRSAAATALHNAAYVLGNHVEPQFRGGLHLGRRRRTLLGDSPGGSGSGTPRHGEGETLALREPIARANRGAEGQSDLFPGRSSSRRNRMDDLEDLMMMEAIRLSLAAEEDRKRREEKEAYKEAKKKAKEDKKQAKRDEKHSKRRGGSGSSLYHASTNDSTSSWAGTSMARSTSNLGSQTIPEEQIQGKGKAPAQDFAGFNPLYEPSKPIDHPQAHLEASRANIQPVASAPIPLPDTARSSHLRQFSNASSAASSFVDTLPGSIPVSGSASNIDLTPGSQNQSQDASPYLTPGLGTTPTQEPMFNFRSLAAMIGEEESGDKPRMEGEHIEHAPPEPSTTTTTTTTTTTNTAEEEVKEPSPSPEPSLQVDGTRSRGDSGESSSTAPPPIYVEHPPTPGVDSIEQAAPLEEMGLVREADKKDYRDVEVVSHEPAREAT